MREIDSLPEYNNQTIPLLGETGNSSIYKNLKYTSQNWLT